MNISAQLPKQRTTPLPRHSRATPAPLLGMAALAALALTGPARAVTTFTGGTVSSGTYTGTTVNGRNFSVNAGGDGAVANSGTTTIIGGTFTGGDAFGGNASGNTGGSGLFVGPGATVIIGGTGPTFTGGDAFGGNTSANTGGSGLFVDGTVDIGGGIFTGGNVNGVGLAVPNGTLDLFGTGFSNTSTGNGRGYLNGTLADGQMLDNTTYFGNGTIEFNVGPSPFASPAPEPSQFGMLALIGLSLGGLILRARPRQRA